MDQASFPSYLFNGFSFANMRNKICNTWHTWRIIALLMTAILIGPVFKKKQLLILLLLLSIQDTTNALLVNKLSGKEDDKINNDLL